MAGYALLLRGVNLGGNNKVAMADLRALLSGLGFADVRTYLNSGNATFTTPDGEPAELASRIEAAMATEFGRSVPCLVRTPAELAKVVAGNPFADVATNGSRMMAHFLFEPINPEIAAELNPAVLERAYVALGDRVIYQWCPDGLMNAPSISEVTDKRLNATTTTRNWNTVTKLSGALNG